LTHAAAEYPGGSLKSGNALIHFRGDGSVERLDGAEGVELETNSGGHVTAPQGKVEFDAQNRPQHGLLEGGAHLDMSGDGREAMGSAPVVRLAFDGKGDLHTAHLEQGVLFNSRQEAKTAK